MKGGAGPYPVGGVGDGTACHRDAEWGGGQRPKTGEEVVKEIPLLYFEEVRMPFEVYLTVRSDWPMSVCLREGDKVKGNLGGLRDDLGRGCITGLTGYRRGVHRQKPL